MRTLHGQFLNNNYTIHIGKDLLSHSEILLPCLSNTQVAIITQAPLLPYLKLLKKEFSHIQCDHLILESGEEQKNLHTAEKIISFLIEHGHQRQTTLIALGGGMIGDITGLVSALYLRGVNFTYIPTTLLAQVDATLGGKCAVNHEMGKNLIGTFYHPQNIIIDITTLETLPEREFNAGLAEVIKHAIAFDSDFFTWVEQHIQQIEERDSNILIELIHKSLMIKQRLVAADERDLLGTRALLNFGHTFGHALEIATKHTLLHGEAVAIGMLIAARISFQLNFINQEKLNKIITLITRINLPHLSFEINLDECKQLLLRDKKNITKDLRMVLLRDIGDAVLQEVDWQVVEKELLYLKHLH